MLESNEYLSNFSSTVAHDIKSPLQNIISHSDILEENLLKKVDNKSNSFHLNKIQSNTQRINRLVDGIFRYSAAIHHSPEDYGLTNINDVITEVISLLEPSKDVKIDLLGDMPTINSNEIHMIQIFQNLVSNALKNLKDENKRIIIRSVPTKDYWHFSVTDTGIGIREEDLKRVMKIFQRVDNESEDSGMGIGLTIVERIVNIYGGTVWITSQFGEGTTVNFTLSKTLLSIVGSS